MTREILSTYRLQLTREFPFAAARAIVPYLHSLGVSHLYLSPILAARRESKHGYDVVDFARVNPELGTEEELRALAGELRALGMGIVLDIVPNHMAASAENPYWDNVLERGAASRYAGWFDIEWDAPRAAGKVVLPVLGDELKAVVKRGELRPVVVEAAVRLAYFDHSFPIDPATLPQELQLAAFDPAGAPAVDEWASGDAGERRLLELLEAQHYRLVPWRHAPHEINYRRFFEINDLVAVRMETQDVFDAMHAQIITWVRDGVLDGLRVDHVDGLRDPAWYLGRLREAVDANPHAGAPARFPIFVEKILGGDEALPDDWPVDGTTGYDFMNEVGEIMVDPDGFRAIEANYRGLRRNPALSFQGVARDGKRRALIGALRPDVDRAARTALRWRPGVSASQLSAAMVELIVHLDAYRTYVVEPGVVRESDRRLLRDAFAAAREAYAEHGTAFDLLEQAFFAKPEPGNPARAELVARLQQTSGPAAAKGVEDTALYAYLPLASRNEVGASPQRTLDGAEARLHDRNGARARDWPRAMLATNTHDTKRSADVRARIDMLSTMADEWARRVSRWRRINKPFKQVVRGKPSPSTNMEYLYYQTLIGIWPAPARDKRANDLPDAEWRQRTRDRMRPYVLKAAREAKLRTSWTESDPEYEKVLDEFARATLHVSSDAAFLSDVARVTARIAAGAAALSLARIAIHLLAPGTPDLYQGDELWNFTLVDPDNRRPVDFQRRARLLSHGDAAGVLRDAFSAARPLTDDDVKLALTRALLRVRREHQALVRDGDYVPLLREARGLFTFARRARQDTFIVLARTRPAGDDVAANALPRELDGHYASALTGREIHISAGGTRAQRLEPNEGLLPAGQPCEVLIARHG